MRRSIRIMLLSLLCFLILCACDSENVSYYTVESDVIHSASVYSYPDVSFGKLPSHWLPFSSSGMRIASILLRDVPTSGFDLSIIRLPGRDVSMIDNVNRWREQLQLAPISEAELPLFVSKQQSDHYEYQRVELENNGKQMVLALFPTHSQTIFVKVAGLSSVINREKDAIYSFFKGVTFDD